jgi:hypothetical protein
MQLSKRVNMKVEQGIQNLDVLQMIKDGIDHEVEPKRIRHPEGPGFIVVYRLQLFAPTVAGDRTTNDQEILIMDPYCDQDTYDQAVRVAYEEIEAMQEAAQRAEVPDELRAPSAQRAVAAALSENARSAAGLIIPGR